MVLVEQFMKKYYYLYLLKYEHEPHTDLHTLGKKISYILITIPPLECLLKWHDYNASYERGFAFLK